MDTFSDCHFMNQAATWLPLWAVYVIFYSKAKRLGKGFEKLADYIQNRIDEHRLDLDPNNMRDVLDYYIRDRDGEKDFTKRRFVCTVMNFMPDSIDTNAHTLMWIILFLGYNQGKLLYQSIMDISGKVCDTLKLL